MGKPLTVFILSCVSGCTVPCAPDGSSFASDRGALVGCSCSFSLERTHCQEFHPTNTTKQNQRLHIKLLAFWQTLNCSASVNSTQCSDHVFVRINRLADPNTSALRAPVMRLVALVGCLKNPHILQFYTTDQYTRLICVFHAVLLFRLTRKGSIKNDDNLTMPGQMFQYVSIWVVYQCSVYVLHARTNSDMHRRHKGIDHCTFRHFQIRIQTTLQHVGSCLCRSFECWLSSSERRVSILYAILHTKLVTPRLCDQNWNSLSELPRILSSTMMSSVQVSARVLLSRPTLALQASTITLQRVDHCFR